MIDLQKMQVISQPTKVGNGRKEGKGEGKVRTLGYHLTRSHLLTGNNKKRKSSYTRTSLRKDRENADFKHKNGNNSRNAANPTSPISKSKERDTLEGELIESSSRATHVGEMLPAAAGRDQRRSHLTISQQHQSCADVLNQQYSAIILTTHSFHSAC